MATVGANTTSYSDTGLTASMSYSYRVAATNGASTSNYSNTVVRCERLRSASNEIVVVVP